MKKIKDMRAVRGMKRFWFIVKRTGLTSMLISFLAVMSAGAIILRIVEPEVGSILDGYWFLFVSATTIGYGDICVTTGIGRLVTVFVALYGIVVTAMIPGVVVTYYTEYLKIIEKDTVSLFLERLEKLPQLSREELTELSEKIKQFNKKQ